MKKLLVIALLMWASFAHGADPKPTPCLDARAVTVHDGVMHLGEGGGRSTYSLPYDSNGMAVLDCRSDTSKSIEIPTDREIKRSRTVVRKFLRLLGRSTTPKGAQVDHIIPLSCGGSDTVDNLQLLWGDTLRDKEIAERDCARVFEYNKKYPCSTPRAQCVKPLR